ncbi:hypothetical protein FSARC_15008, partial [Fusarium sarcochroum]
MGSINHEEDPASQQEHQSMVVFRLPDAKTEVWIDAVNRGKAVAYEVGQGRGVLSRWTTADQKVRVSPSMVNDDVAEYEDLLQFEIAEERTPAVDFAGSAGQDDLALLWASIYSLWVHPQLRENDLIPVVVNSERLGEYLRCSGLGVISPFSTARSTTTEVPRNAIFWLHREAFWQGAGAPDSQTWVQCRPEVTQFPGFGTNVDFPTQLSFTQKGNVSTVHPVRPPKAAPGTLLYSRFIVEIGQTLQIFHIDANNPEHFNNYAKWQNSDRVNAGWRERGPDEHHRKYLESQLADPHTMSCVFSWDEQLA